MIQGFTVIWAGRLGWDGSVAKEGGARVLFAEKCRLFSV
jgi:hypothetical protein